MPTIRNTERCRNGCARERASTFRIVGQPKVIQKRHSRKLAGLLPGSRLVGSDLPIWVDDGLLGKTSLER